MNPAFRLAVIVFLSLLSFTVYAQSDTKVYVTKTGAKYHRSSCRYAKTGWPATLTEAKDRGLTACLVCKPGGGSASTSSSTSTNSLKSTPSSSNTTTTTSSSQCIATTKAGSRCSRKAASGSSYCWQHEG